MITNTNAINTDDEYDGSLGAHVSSAGAEEEEDTYDEMVAAAEAEVEREQAELAAAGEEYYFYNDADGGDDGDDEDSGSESRHVEERTESGERKRVREEDNLCPGRKRRIVTVVQWNSAMRTNMIATLNRV